MDETKGEQTDDHSSRPKNMLEGENVVVHHTQPVGGDVPSVGHVHEERDVPIGTLMKATAILLVGIIVVAFAMWGLFELLAMQADRADPEVSPMVQRRLPVEPRLQSNPGRDMTAFRQREETELVARRADTAGVQRIPIEEAMDLIAERGMPRFVPSLTGDSAARDSGSRTGSAVSGVPATATSPGGPPVGAPPAAR